MKAKYEGCKYCECFECSYDCKNCNDCNEGEDGWGYCKKYRDSLEDKQIKLI